MKTILPEVFKYWVKLLALPTKVRVPPLLVAVTPPMEEAARVGVEPLGPPLVAKLTVRVWDPEPTALGNWMSPLVEETVNEVGRFKPRLITTDSDEAADKFPALSNKYNR